MTPRPALSRRRFLTQTSAGLGGAVAGLDARPTRGADQSSPPTGEPPRQVWIASIGQMKLEAPDPDAMCRKMLERMAETLPLQPDLICTPEVFPFVGLPGGKRPPLSRCAEERTGPVLDSLARFAAAHRCYVLCSTYTQEAGRFYNASVLLDRQGRYVGEYRKINPTEGELERGVTPGPIDPPVFTTDFGRIGVQICYDVNWYENWTRLARKGAEIVFWPSAFGGGKMLNSLAWMNKFYVVTSTRFEHPTKIVDPLGFDVVRTGRAGPWVCSPINLDVAVVQSVAHIQKFKRIRKKYGRRFLFRILHVEALATIEGRSDEVSVADVLREFDIPTSRQMIAASTRAQNARRPPA